MKQGHTGRLHPGCLQSYTPVSSYYRLVKTIEGDPEYDVKRARKSYTAMSKGTTPRSA